MRFLAAFTVLGAACMAERMPVYLYSGEWNAYDAPIANKLLAYAAAGASHLLLAFHVYTPDWASSNYLSGSAQQVAELSDSDRKALFDKLHAAGTEVILSTGGESAGITWASTPPAEYAENLCTLAQKLGVDGVDFDLENLPPGFGSSLTATYPKWNLDAITECRKHFSGYITAAPQSPYVMKEWAGTYGYDAYGFDRLLIQYYNQGVYFQEHVKDGFLGNHDGSIPDLMKRNPSALPNTFVLGKPLIPSEGWNMNDGFEGGELGRQYNDDELKDWACEAWNNGWRGGFMFWMGHWDDPTAQMKIAKMAAPCPGSSEPITEPATQPITEPATQPITEPATQPITEPATKPITEPITKPATEPITKPATEPATKPTEPVTKTAETTTVVPTKPTEPITLPTEAITIPLGVEYPTICPGGSVSDPVIRECISKVKSEPWWVEGCQANCLTIGKGGCLHGQFCPNYDGTAESLLGCVVKNYPQCSY